MGKTNIIDFYIKFDPEKDSKESLARKILYSIFIKRIKAKKPVVAAIIAKSGEGKSYACNKLIDEIMMMQGVDLVKNIKFFDVATIANPLQYAEKLDKILNDKEYKKINCMAVHDSRTVISSTTWRSFVNTAIADVNALSRAVKPLMFFFISQAWKDIDSNIRSTITHYITVSRPNSKNYSRMEISVVWNDERDIEKPKFKKRKIRGVVIYPDGRYRYFTPDSLYIKWLRKPLQDRFEKLDYEGKQLIIKNKMNKILSEIKTEMGDYTEKIDSMVEWYVKHTDSLAEIAKRTKKGWSFKKTVKDLHDLSPGEVKLFQDRFNDKMSSLDMVRMEEENNEK